MSHIIQLDYNAAVAHLSLFIDIETHRKKMFKRHLELAFRNGTYKLLKYRAKYGVDMERSELLRDVVFIGTSLVEQSSNNIWYYKAVVKACLSIVEMETEKSFSDEFAQKMLKAISSFQCNQGVHFSSEAFYFVFKTHFRLN